MAFENTKSLIRSCVVSTKKGLTLRQLERDFEDLVGSPIPFQDHGFQSLDLFLRSIPDTVRLTAVGRHTLVEHVPDESVAGIASLVSRQKGKPRKGAIVLKTSSRNKYSKPGPQNNRHRYSTGAAAPTGGFAPTRHTAVPDWTGSGGGAKCGQSSAAARLQSTPAAASPAEHQWDAMQDDSESGGPARRASSVAPAGRRLLSTAGPSLSTSSDLSGGGRPARAAPALCTQHRPPRVCQRPSCDALHVCRLYVDGFCPHGDTACRWGHAVASDDNQAALAAHQLQVLPERELLWLVRALLRQTAPVAAEEYRSQLAVCSEYAADARCGRPDCFQLHLCPQLAAGGCRAGDSCRWSHRLTDPDNLMVLLRLRCAELSEAEVLARLAQRPDDDGGSSDGAKTSGIGSGHGSSQDRSVRDKDDWGPVRSGPGDVVSGVPGISQAQPNAAVNDSSKDPKELAREINLCQVNIHPSRCSGDCRQLHMCRLFVAGMCSHADKCRTGHNLYSSHNSKVLKERGLERLSEGDLLNALKAGYLARNPITGFLGVCRDSVASRPIGSGAEGIVSSASGVRQRTQSTPGSSALTDPKRLARDMNLCQHNIYPSRCKRDCRQLHLCRLFVADMCPYAGTCRSGHNLYSLHNSKVLVNRGLDQLSEEELLVAIQYGYLSRNPITDVERCFALQICAAYQYGDCCEENCVRLHVCGWYVVGTCANGSGCGLSHNIRSGDNATIIKLMGLSSLSHGDLLDVLDDPPTARDVWLNVLPCGDPVTYRPVGSGAQGVGSSAPGVRQKTPNTLRSSPFTDPRRLAQDVNLCRHNIYPSYCKRDCRKLHLCRLFVADMCPYAGTCRSGHDLYSSHNSKVLIERGLDHLSEEQLLESIYSGYHVRYPITDLERRFALQICDSYQYGNHCGEDCLRLHVCGWYVVGTCGNGSGCGLSHNIRSAGNATIIRLMGLSSLSHADICDVLVDPPTVTDVWLSLSQ